MFEKYSLTYAGAIAGFIASMTLLSEAEALNFVNALIVVISTAMTLYGRYRAGGVNKLGIK